MTRLKNHSNMIILIHVVTIVLYCKVSSIVSASVISCSASDRRTSRRVFQVNGGSERLRHFSTTWRKHFWTSCGYSCLRASSSGHGTQSPIPTRSHWWGIFAMTSRCSSSMVGEELIVIGWNKKGEVYYIINFLTLIRRTYL